MLTFAVSVIKISNVSHALLGHIIYYAGQITT